MAKYAGKVILITGASSGIGLATAKKFASLGASLSLLGRNADALSKLEADIKSTYQVKASCHRCDVTNQGEVDQAVAATVDTFGRLDVLVNSAGVLHPATAQATTPEIFDLNFSTNTRGPFLLMRACIPHLEGTKGCIVNVSSVNGMQSFAGTMAYCASKVSFTTERVVEYLAPMSAIINFAMQAALDHMTRCAAVDLAPRGIRVNCVRYRRSLLHREPAEPNGIDPQLFQHEYLHSRWHWWMNMPLQTSKTA